MKPPGDHSYNDERARARWQVVNNTDWPPADIAARSCDKEPDEWIPVCVRLELERDGEVWVDGQATRWIGRKVCVLVGDPRLQVPWVWLAAEDVRRRGDDHAHHEDAGT
jgi:hypothetical protein